jgi:hypothetical protein
MSESGKGRSGRDPVFFGALRPWISCVFVLALLVPFLAAVAYTNTLSGRDAMLFLIGGGEYASAALASIGVLWAVFAAVFILTRFGRTRPLLLKTEVAEQGFDKRAREAFIASSVVLSLTVAVWCLLRLS